VNEPHIDIRPFDLKAADEAEYAAMNVFSNRMRNGGCRMTRRSLSTPCSTRCFASVLRSVSFEPENADSNEPMLKINYELGFNPYISECIWQVETEKVLGYLDA
jgi:hypothetical protein